MPAASVLDAVNEFVEELKAAGFRAKTSRKDVQPPGVYVALDQVDYVLSGTEFDLTVQVYLVSPDVENEGNALKQIDELHQKYLDAGFMPGGTSQVVGLNLPNAPKPFPALRVTANLTTL